MVRQLRDRVLEVCCEEQMAKMSLQEERAMEEERANQLRGRKRSEKRELVEKQKRGSGENQLGGHGRGFGGSTRVASAEFW